MDIRKIEGYNYSYLNNNPRKTITMEQMSKRILRAIKAGNHDTRYIVEACKAECLYWLFCESIANLIKESRIVCKEVCGEYGYYLN